MGPSEAEESSDDTCAPTHLLANQWLAALDAPGKGIDPVLLARAAHEARHNLRTLYSLLVIRNGYIVFEEHYHDHEPRDAYSVRSVTKSITSALVGIAYQDQYLTSLDQTVAELLPEHIAADADPRKRAITVQDVLTMQAGLKWDEADEWKLSGSANWLAFYS